MLMRLVSFCLIVTQLAGCAATRQINFDSKPAGATVKLIGSTCTTPCVMRISSNEVQFAEISLASGQKRDVRIEPRPTVSERIGYRASIIGATTTKYIAMPLLAVGFFGLLLLSGNETDTFNNRDYEADRRGFYITMGALASGLVLYAVAHGMKEVSSDLQPEQNVYVIFDVPANQIGSDNKLSITLDEFLGIRKIFPPNNH